MEINDKLRVSTTDNGSNFIKCFREKGATSALPYFEEQRNAEFEDNQEFMADEGLEEEMVRFEICDLLSRILLAKNIQNENVTLPVHRRCACNLQSHFRS